MIEEGVKKTTISNSQGSLLSRKKFLLNDEQTKPKTKVNCLGRT